MKKIIVFVMYGLAIVVVILLITVAIISRKITGNVDYFRSSENEKKSYELSLKNFEDNRKKYEQILDYKINENIGLIYVSALGDKKCLKYEVLKNNIWNTEECCDNCDDKTKIIKKMMINLKINSIYTYPDEKNVLIFKRENTDDARDFRAYEYNINGWSKKFNIKNYKPGDKIGGYNDRYIIDDNWIIVGN